MEDHVGHSPKVQQKRKRSSCRYIAIFHIRFALLLPRSNLVPRVLSLASRKNRSCGWSHGNVCLNCAALSSVISNKIAKFACNYLNPDMKHLTVVDPGEGPGGPGPLYYSATMRPLGPKKNILEHAPPPPISGSG